MTMAYVIGQASPRTKHLSGAWRVAVIGVLGHVAKAEDTACRSPYTVAALFYLLVINQLRATSLTHNVGMQQTARIHT